MKNHKKKPLVYYLPKNNIHKIYLYIVYSKTIFCFVLIQTLLTYNHNKNGKMN